MIWMGKLPGSWHELGHLSILDELLFSFLYLPSSFTWLLDTSSLHDWILSFLSRLLLSYVLFYHTLYIAAMESIIFSGFNDVESIVEV